MNDNMRVISTEEELKIFNDPYRMKIIRTFQKSTKSLTVKGCADEMGEVPAKVHYHVKKLLSIDILELDYTEVINGITAKYYKLKNDSFTISLKEAHTEQMYQHLAHVHSILTTIIDDFKDEFMKSSSYAVEAGIQEDSEVGVLSSGELYLSKDEFEEVSKLLKEIADKYKTEKADKQKYIFLGGLGKKQ